MGACVVVNKHFPRSREEAHDPSMLVFVKTTTTIDLGNDIKATICAQMVENNCMFG